MIDERYDHPGKVYVDVLAKFHKRGYIEPIFFIWEDGVKYKIDSINEVRKAASLKAGGAGIRYCVKVADKETYLFLEENCWFMER